MEISIVRIDNSKETPVWGNHEIKYERSLVGVGRTGTSVTVGVTTFERLGEFRILPILGLTLWIGLQWGNGSNRRWFAASEFPVHL